MKKQKKEYITLTIGFSDIQKIVKCNDNKELDKVIDSITKGQIHKKNVSVASK